MSNFSNQWNTYTLNDLFCLHLSSYRYNIILLANQWSAFTKMSINVAIFHPEKSEK